MVDNLVIPGEFFYAAFIPLFATAIPIVYGVIQRKQLTGSKSVVIDMSVAQISKSQEDMKESLRELVREMREEREKASDISQRMMRDIDNIKWRLTALEQKNKNGAL